MFSSWISKSFDSAYDVYALILNLGIRINFGKVITTSVVVALAKTVVACITCLLYNQIESYVKGKNKEKRFLLLAIAADFAVSIPFFFSQRNLYNFFSKRNSRYYILPSNIKGSYMRITKFLDMDLTAFFYSILAVDFHENKSLIYSINIR